MRSVNEDYGWDINMSVLRALRVVWWRVVQHETWRGIAEKWEYSYPENPRLELKGNQFYGVTVIDCAATTLGLASYVAWPLNR